MFISNMHCSVSTVFPKTVFAWRVFFGGDCYLAVILMKLNNSVERQGNPLTSQTLATFAHVRQPAGHRGCPAAGAVFLVQCCYPIILETGQLNWYTLLL